MRTHPSENLTTTFCVGISAALATSLFVIASCVGVYWLCSGCTQGRLPYKSILPLHLPFIIADATFFLTFSFRHACVDKMRWGFGVVCNQQTSTHCSTTNTSTYPKHNRNRNHMLFCSNWTTHLGQPAHMNERHSISLQLCNKTTGGRSRQRGRGRPRGREMELEFPPLGYQAHDCVRLASGGGTTSSHATQPWLKWQ